MTKFELNAIAKQDAAYTIKYAKRCFAVSCEMCASRGLRNGRGTCVSCPILKAHQKALEAIARDQRDHPRTDKSRKYTNGKHVTIVLRFD